MDIEVRYCGMCGGKDQADHVVEEVQRYLSVEASLLDVGKGVFEVRVDGETIFSKQQAGRFPLRGEIVRICRKKYK